MFTRGCTILLLVCAAALFSACQPDGGGGDGDSGGGGPQSPPSNPPAAPGTLLASFDVPSAGFYYNPPTLAGGRVYVGSSRHLNANPAADNAFYCFDEDLNEVWSYALGENEVRGSAALDAQGNVYFVVDEDRAVSNPRWFLYSLDALGGFRWSVLIRSQWDHQGMVSPAVNGSVIYVGGDFFYAFDSAGTELWRYGTGLSVTNAPAIDGTGNLYFNARRSGTAVSISLDSGGNERWVFDTGADVEAYSSPALATGQVGVVAALGDAVYRLNASSGGVEWSYTPASVSGSFRASPALDEQDNVYLGTKANQSSVFYAIRYDGSGLLWEYPSGADLYSSPVLGDDGLVYVGAEYNPQGQLLGLNSATGALEWSETLAFDVTWCSPALSDAGVLYIGTMSDPGGSTGGTIYAWQTAAQGFRAGAPWPRFHGNNEGNGLAP